jgi:hypothetical protein
MERNIKDEGVFVHRAPQIQWCETSKKNTPLTLSTPQAPAASLPQMPGDRTYHFREFIDSHAELGSEIKTT